MDLPPEDDSNRRPEIAASKHKEPDSAAVLPASSVADATSKMGDEAKSSDTGVEKETDDEPEAAAPLGGEEEPDAKKPPAAGLVILRELGPTDILLGRGALAVRNPGNKHFAQIIAQRKAEYKSTGNRRLKDTIVSQVLQAVRNSQGRFVRKVDGVDEMKQFGIDAHENAWIEVDVAAAAHKAKQSLRDKDPTLKSKSHSRNAQGHQSDEDEDDSVEQLKKPAKQPRMAEPPSLGDDDCEDTRLVDSKPRAVPSNRTSNLQSAMDTVAGPVSNQYDMTGDRTLASSLMLNELQRCEQPRGLDIGGTTRHLLAPRNVRDTEAAPVDFATLQAILGLRGTNASAHRDFTQRALYPAMESVPEPLLFPGSAANALPVVDALIAEQVRRLQGVDTYSAPSRSHTLARQPVDPANAAATTVEQQMREIVRLTELQDEMQRQRQRQEQQQQLLVARAATLRDYELLAGLGTSGALPFLGANERQRRNDNDALLSMLHGSGTNQPSQALPNSNVFNPGLLSPSLSNSVAYGSSSSSGNNQNHGRLEPSLAALLAATMPSRSVAAPAVAAPIHSLFPTNLSMPNANLSSLTPLQREMLRQRLLLRDGGNAGPDDVGMPNDDARQGPRNDGFR